MAHPNSKRAKAAKAARDKARRTTSADQQERADAARAARTVAREQREREERRLSVLRKGRTIALAVLAVVILLAGSWLLLRPDAEIEGVERPPDLGGGHVTGATYQDAAPTSGAHSASAPTCGIYQVPLDLDLAVHALEHGVVVLWYQADQVALGAELASVTSEWDSHVIISPSTTIDAPIVATAWNRRMSYNAADDGVAEFVDTYRRRGPESVACDI